MRFTQTARLVAKELLIIAVTMVALDLMPEARAQKQAGNSPGEGPTFTYPYCARIFNIGTTVGDRRALDDFLARFGLELREYINSRGVKDWEVSFCGSYSADSRDLAHTNPKPPNSRYSRYALTGFEINGRVLGLDPYPSSRVNVTLPSCGGIRVDCYQVEVAVGLKPKTYPFLQFEFDATMPAGTFATDDLPANNDFLPLATDLLSPTFGYWIQTPEGKFPTFQGDTEWKTRPDAIVEFAGPEVLESNLKLRTAPAIPDSPVEKTAVVFCDTDTSGSVSVDVSQYLSPRSVRYPLEWTSDEPFASPNWSGSFDFACPLRIHPTSGPGATYIAIDDAMNAVTVTAAYAGNEAISDHITIIILPQRTKDRFRDWYSDESTSNGWLSLLPPVYPQLLINSHTKEPELYPDGWHAPCGPNFSWPPCPAWPSNFHPGASFEMRSEVTAGGHGHQAVYDAKGQLITDSNCPVIGPAGFPCISAGSADRSHPANLLGEKSHYQQDVLPFIWAAQLDGNPVKGTFLEQLRPIFDLSGPLIRIGQHMKQFFKVRPTLPTGIVIE